jgi:hypothetical protein
VFDVSALLTGPGRVGHSQGSKPHSQSYHNEQRILAAIDTAVFWTKPACRLCSKQLNIIDSFGITSHQGIQFYEYSAQSRTDTYISWPQLLFSRRLNLPSRVVIVYTTKLNFKKFYILPAHLRVLYGSQQTVIIFLYNINRLVSATVTEDVHCTVRAEFFITIQVNPVLQPSRWQCVSPLHNPPSTNNIFFFVFDLLFKVTFYPPSSSFCLCRKYIYMTRFCYYLTGGTDENHANSVLRGGLQANISWKTTGRSTQAKVW